MCALCIGTITCALGTLRVFLDALQPHRALGFHGMEQWNSGKCHDSLVKDPTSQFQPEAGVPSGVIYL